MTIYTKKGDGGETVGLDQLPLSKADLRICALGAVDELNSHLGVVTAMITEADITKHLQRVQDELFFIGSYLSSNDVSFLATIETDRLEKEIDYWTNTLPPLKNFVLPGGTQPAAMLYLTRSICRRAEREIVVLYESQPLDPILLKYINRLSDWLFTLARYHNYLTGTSELVWKRIT